MKKAVIGLLVLLAFLSTASLPAGAETGESESVALVRSMFSAMSGEGDKSIFKRTTDTKEHIESLAETDTLFFNMYVRNLTLSETEPGFVRYSCEIPSPVYVALDAAGFIDAFKYDSSFTSVKVEGILPVIMLDAEPYIGISGGKNPFSLFLYLRKYNGDVSFIPGVYDSKDQISTVIEKLNTIVSETYNRVLDVSLDPEINRQEVSEAVAYAAAPPVAAKTGESENVALARSVFSAISSEVDQSIFQKTMDTKEHIESQANTATLFFHMYTRNLVLSESKPGFVGYSCEIPSPAYLALDAAGFIDASKYDSSFKGIKVEGVLRIIMSDGKPAISIIEKDNPISLYYNLRRYNGSVPFIPGMYDSKDQISAVIKELNTIIFEEYNRELSTDLDAATNNKELSAATAYATALPAKEVEESENIALVRSVFSALTYQGDKSIFKRTLDTKEHIESRANTATLLFNMYIRNLKLSEPEKGFVLYSCEIPSPAYVALDMAGIVDASEYDSSFSSLEVEGVLPIITRDNEPYVDISGRKDPVSLYINLCRYNRNPAFMPGVYGSKEHISAVIEELNAIVCGEYNRVLDANLYTEANRRELSQATTNAEIAWEVSKKFGVNIQQQYKDNQQSQQQWAAIGKFINNKVVKIILICVGAVLILILGIFLALKFFNLQSRISRAYSKSEKIIRRMLDNNTNKKPVGIYWSTRLTKLLTTIPKNAPEDFDCNKGKLRSMMLLAFDPKVKKKYLAMIAENLDSLWKKSDLGDVQKDILYFSYMAMARICTQNLSDKNARDYILPGIEVNDKDESLWLNLIKENKSAFPYLVKLTVNSTQSSIEGILVGLHPFFKKYENELAEEALNILTACVIYERTHSGFRTALYSQPGDSGYYISFENWAMEKEVERCSITSDVEYKKQHTNLDTNVYTPQLDKMKEEWLNDAEKSGYIPSSFSEILLDGAKELGNRILKNVEEMDVLYLMISLFFSPISNKNIIAWLSSTLADALISCREKADVTNTTIAGWTAAALGRCVTSGNNYSGFADGLKDEKADAVMKEYNSIVKQINEIQGKYDYSSRSTFSSLQEKIKGGFLVKCIEADVNPMFYLSRIACDNQHEYGSRFVTQGAIMGLLPFLLRHHKEAEFSDIFKRVISTRASIISSDDKLSFFEVRVPGGCSPKEYASILKEVVWCANPTLSYADIWQTMKTATSEIPGVMKLLTKYPLRLIDPVNVQTEGFYEFEPFEHKMWVRYQPPVNEGQVINRYHEVADLTVPNSLGLKLSLFTDIYAVIPTLYHEYCHYLCDRNEANVFLQTYLFSAKFYQKYPDANPLSDYTYIVLSKMLGNDPRVGKTGDLNEMIEKYYGKNISEKDAALKADAYMQNANASIRMANMRETWCPEVKMPLLKDESNSGDIPWLLNEPVDSHTYKTLKQIIIRYHTTRKTVTKPEFNATVLQNS